jgi:rubrerythrin
MKGTRTEQNLLKSFAGESQARNRYTFFAEQALDEGYTQIAELFLETAENELEHARKFFSFLPGGPLEITAGYPAGIVGTTAENLAAAAGGEREEWAELYPQFAAVAAEEGFKDVAAAYKLIAKVEAEHEARYRKLLARVEKDEVWSRAEKVRWKCRACGHIHEGTKAPARCPICDAEREEFEVAAENY